MTNLARRSDYNWRGAEIELLASHYSPILPGVPAAEQNSAAAAGQQGVAALKKPEADTVQASGLRLVPAELSAKEDI